VVEPKEKGLDVTFCCPNMGMPLLDELEELASFFVLFEAGPSASLIFGAKPNGDCACG